MLAIAASALTGCATPPYAIHPYYVSDLPYRQYDCTQLQTEQDSVIKALASASDTQRKTENKDFTGVLLLGAPLGSMVGGNLESEIGLLKGELVAIRDAGAAKDCNLPDTTDLTRIRHKHINPDTGISYFDKP